MLFRLIIILIFSSAASASDISFFGCEVSGITAGQVEINKKLVRIRESDRFENELTIIFYHKNIKESVEGLKKVTNFTKSLVFDDDGYSLYEVYSSKNGFMGYSFGSDGWHSLIHAGDRLYLLEITKKILDGCGLEDQSISLKLPPSGRDELIRNPG